MNNLINKVIDGFSTWVAKFAASYVVLSKNGSHCSASRNDKFGLPFGLVNIELLENNFAIGAHLISPRSFYMHHGIHIGGGKVAHYSGFSSSLRAGPIEITDLGSFANGRPVWACQESRTYSAAEIVTRARSRVGESQYRILSNNCEHFCSWCVSGENYSAQVSAYLHCPRCFLSFISAVNPLFIA